MLEEIPKKGFYEISLRIKWMIHRRHTVSTLRLVMIHAHEDELLLLQMHQPFSIRQQAQTEDNIERSMQRTQHP